MGQKHYPYGIIYGTKSFYHFGWETISDGMFLLGNYITVILEEPVASIIMVTYRYWIPLEHGFCTDIGFLWNMDSVQILDSFGTWILFPDYIVTLILIYLLTAIGLSPGGSTHLHTGNT
jgi:hypothetical protein